MRTCLNARDKKLFPYPIMEPLPRYCSTQEISSPLLRKLSSALNTVRLRNLLVKASRGGRGSGAAGGERANSLLALSSPASPASPAYPNRISSALAYQEGRSTTKMWR